MAKRADVIMATSLVRTLSHIKEDGSFVEPMLETYALYLGLGLDDAEQAVEEATKLMTEEGELCEVNGELRFSDRYQEFQKARERDKREAEQADFDKAQAFDVLTGIHGRSW